MSAQGNQPKPSEELPDKPTLSSFIEDNHKLITVLGVFTALTVFASSLTLKPMGLVLSFLFMTLAAIVWLELCARFPSKSGTWRLTWFENILSFTVLAFIAYWLLDFRTIWKNLLLVLVGGLILAVVSATMKRFGLFNRLFRAQPGKKRVLRYVIWLLLVSATIFLSFWLAGLVTPSINRALDVITETMRTPAP